MMDDDELLGELDALEGMLMEEEMTSAPVVPTKTKVKYYLVNVIYKS